jgi:hypothetical protein
MPPTTLPICTTPSDCNAHDNERIEVVGIYSIWDPRVGVTSEASRSRHVLVKLTDTGDGPFLEAGSDKRHKRALEEIERFRDKRVRVIGRFVRWMPQRDDDSAQLGGACISDIESITLAE